MHSINGCSDSGRCSNVPRNCRFTDTHWLLLWLVATAALVYGVITSSTVDLIPLHYPTNSAGSVCGTDATSPANTNLFTTHPTSPADTAASMAFCVPECSSTNASWTVCSTTATALQQQHRETSDPNASPSPAPDCDTQALSTVAGYPSTSLLHRCIPLHPTTRGMSVKPLSNVTATQLQYLVRSQLRLHQKKKKKIGHCTSFYAHSIPISSIANSMHHAIYTRPSQSCSAGRVHTASASAVP